MNVIKYELLKLRSKSRGWLGPILVFILILVAFPLTIEVSNKDLGQSFFSVLWIAILLVMMLATEDIFLEENNLQFLKLICLMLLALRFLYIGC
jgi:ABC-type transport system involved in cytochrome c biogenesis permease component